MALTASDIDRLRRDAQRRIAMENAITKQDGHQSTATFNGRAAGQMLEKINSLEQEVKRLKAQIRTEATR